MKILELDKYKESVALMAANHSELIFSNDGPEHACIVACEIFRNSNKTVNIFTKSMSGIFAGKSDYLSAMTNFIDRGGKVNILVTDSSVIEANCSSFVTTLKNNYPGYIENLNIKKTSMPSTTPTYFMTGDSNKFRMQVNDKYKALVCFNDPQSASQFDRIHELLRLNAVEIPIVRA